MTLRSLVTMSSGLGYEEQGLPWSDDATTYYAPDLRAEALGDSERSGFEKLESGVNAVPRDYARFGHLFAHEGRVLGRQVVAARWVEEATARDTSGDPAEHYQYGWWVDTERGGRFYARGNHGRFVYVDPATDVVRLGREDGDVPWPEVLRDVADRVAAAGS